MMPSKRQPEFGFANLASIYRMIWNPIGSNAWTNAIELRNMMRRGVIPDPIQEMRV
jgi:hypothetical protein